MTRFFFLIGAVVACTSAVHATTVFVSPLFQPATVGSIVTFYVNLSASEDVNGFDLAIQYPSFLTYEGVMEEGFFAANGSGLGFADAVDNPGYVTTLFDFSSGPDTLAESGGVDTLFAISFQANDVGTGTIQIVCDGPNDCADFPMLADDGTPVTVDSTSPGFIAVTPAATVPEPSFTFVIAALAGFLGYRQAKGRRATPTR